MESNCCGASEWMPYSDICSDCKEHAEFLPDEEEKCAECKCVTQFDIEKVLEAGKLQNELEYERALIADRKLRVLCKENYRLKPLRKKLRDLIEQYEAKNWSSNSKIGISQIKSIVSGPVDPDKMLQIIETAQDMPIQNHLGDDLYMESFHNAEDVKKILSGLETFERTVSVMPTHPYYYDEDEEEVSDWDKLENQDS